MVSSSLLRSGTAWPQDSGSSRTDGVTAGAPTLCVQLACSQEQA